MQKKNQTKWAINSLLMINTCPEENASSPLETDSAYAVHIFFNYKYKNYAHHFTIYTPYIHVHQFSMFIRPWTWLFPFLWACWFGKWLPAPELFFPVFLY